MKAVSRFVFGLMIASSLLLFAGCAPLIAPEPAAMPAPEPIAGELTIVDAWARPVPLADGNSAVYFTVLNGLEAEVSLISGLTSAAPTLEFHETQEDEGIMRMIPQPDGFAIPAGGAVVLEPGGKHVMLLHVAQPLVVGNEIDVTLNFSDGTTLDLTVPVAEPPDKTMHMGG